MERVTSIVGGVVIERLDPGLKGRVDCSSAIKQSLCHETVWQKAPIENARSLLEGLQWLLENTRHIEDRMVIRRIIYAQALPKSRLG